MEKSTVQKKNKTDVKPIINKSQPEPNRTEPNRTEPNRTEPNRTELCKPEQSHPTNYQMVQHRTRLNRTTQPKITQPQTANHQKMQPPTDHHTSHASHTQPHHTHSHENTKAVLNRLSRAIGHLKSIKTMVEDGRDCSEVLIQLSAVKAAINNTGKVVLKDHLSHCLVDSIETGNMQAIEELNKAIDQFVK